MFGRDKGWKGAHLVSTGLEEARLATPELERIGSKTGLGGVGFAVLRMEANC